MAGEDNSNSIITTPTTDAGEHQGASSGNAAVPNTAVPNTAHNEVILGPQAAAPPQSAAINSLHSPPVVSMHGVSSYTPFAPPINGVNPASQALPLDSLNSMLQDGEASFQRSLFEPSPQQNGVKQLGAPLGRFVSLATKEKIWRGEYVELGSLLSIDCFNSTPPQLSVVAIGQQLCLKPAMAQAKHIFNIDKWTEAFFVYISIFLQRHPNRAIELIKYTDLIRKLAQRFNSNGWVHYDLEFRLEQALNPMRSWACYDSDLLLEKLALPTFAGLASMSGQQSVPHANRVRNNFRPNQQSASGRPQQVPLHCFNYNTSGSCKRFSCKYPHRCSVCFKYGHPATGCTSAQASKRGMGPNGGQGNIPARQQQPSGNRKPNFIKSTNTSSGFSA